MKKQLMCGVMASMLALSGGGTVIGNVADLHFGLIASAATSAKSGTCGMNLTWTLDDEGTLTISGTGNMNNYDLQDSPWRKSKAVKKVIIGKGVTGIGRKAFHECSALTSVTIPDSVTYIESSAFSACSSLTNITIPNSVTSIGFCVFEDCTNLTGLYIPASVTSIKYNAFYGCSVLARFEVDSKNAYYKSIDNVLYTKKGDTLIFCPRSKTSITIPDTVTNIGEQAFYYCSSLKNITIPNGVKIIGDSAFNFCTNLTSIYIPESVTNISFDAFNCCPALVRFDVDSKNAYYRSLDNVLYTKKGDTLIFCPQGKTSVTIPHGVKTIGSCAFADCKYLTSITIPNSVIYIDEYAFESCTDLASVNIPGSVKNIGWGAFQDCPNLKSVTIPNSVTSIGTGAFGFTGDAWSPTKYKDFKIYCYKNSAGEKYAINNKFDHEIINTDIVPTAISGEGSVRLTWEAVSGAEKYAVCSYANGKWKKLAEGNGTSYTINDLTAGTEYKLAVIANLGGNWITDFSNAVVVTPNAPRYPKVTDIEYNEEFHQFRLKWNAVENATEYGVAVKLAGNWRVHTYTDKTTFTSPKLKAGKTYEMAVCAKVNGDWDTTAINRRSFSVTVK